MSKYRSIKSSSKRPDSLNQIDEMAIFLKALAHPHRLRIFLKLAKICDSNSCNADASACVGQAGKGLDIVPSTLSHHIKELKNAGLLNIEKSGQKNECSVNKTALSKIQSFFSAV